MEPENPKLIGYVPKNYRPFCCERCIDCDNTLCCGRKCERSTEPTCILCGCEEFDGKIPIFDWESIKQDALSKKSE